MRLKISLAALDENPSIDLNYNYHLASLIYRSIERADRKLSLELHSPSGPKLLTFSRLFVPEKCFSIENGRMILEDSSVHFFFSSPLPELCEALVSGLLMKPEVRIGDARFGVSSIEVLKERELRGREKFITMSPIHVSSVEGSGVRRRKVDLYPDDPRFYEILRKNLVKKYIMLHGEPPESDELEIEVLDTRAKMIRVKNTNNRCVEMVFLARGSRELMEVGYK
ncbi:MAG: CRISPR-associated endoribonuclease Cas6 [Archaeoglobi archaeon]|nr:CRISPR-associated endoribonuclease Cas6 [Archaeoglobi archaeon]